MVEFIKENRRILICTVLALIAGMLIGASIVLAVYSNQKESIQRERGAGVELSSVVQNTTFSACGHTASHTVESSELSLLDIQTIASQFPDSTVKKETDGTIVVQKEVDGYCPEHFVLKCDDMGTLSVYKTNPQTAVSEEVQKLSNDVSLLENDLVAELENGLAFASMADIDVYLENIES